MRHGTLEADLGDLLDTLCAEWGIRLPPTDRAQIAASPRLTADEFARLVLTAEGFFPDQERMWFQELRRRFRERFGESVAAEGYAGSPRR